MSSISSMPSMVTALFALSLLAQGSYVPHRVFDNARGGFTDFEMMLADVARADVVFVGEQHDDVNTHRLELAILEGLARRREQVIVSLEMFERDAREPLDHFLTGHLAEDEFLKVSRPWPRYKTDYKPLVDFAIAKQWPVVAANVPRPLASEVSKGGLTVLDAKTGDDRALFARDLQCPTDDDYFKRFGEAMGGHPAEGATVAQQREMTERFYFAQCVKDETMAESIAEAYTAAAAPGRRPLVVHYNGAFHSDFTTGTASRVIRRMPGKRVVVITVLPVQNLDTAEPGPDDRRRANYLIYTVREKS
jgi:uncharacterized iron-regulated protein